VLNAGNFGVSQSRKRTFIYGAAPGETLPDWPKLMHVFRSPQLTINLPGGVAYTAVPQREVGADAGGKGRARIGEVLGPDVGAPWCVWPGPCAPQLPPLPSTQSAPLRTVTVRDAIGDLPLIQNGHDQ
jgi:DNA (cytosine-5)-methyltransferase 1